MTSYEPRKRQKITRACDICRVNKKRCTGTLPCQSCTKSGKPCTYDSSYTRGTPASPLLNPDSEFVACRKDRPLQAETLSPISASQASSSSLDEDDQRDSVDLPEDTQSNPVGSASAYIWLRRAWIRLGRARKTFAKTLDQDDFVQSSSIFAHGDGKSPIQGKANLTIISISQTSLLSILTTFFNRSSATYRYLHQPSVISWLQKFHQQPEKVPCIHAAILHAVLAHGYIYMTSEEQEVISRREQNGLSAESFYLVAKQFLEAETGPPRLASVQARLVMVHYLLCTSRPNQAWYTFGTVVQLSLALNLHQKNQGQNKRQNEGRGGKGPLLLNEFRKRTFGVVYLFDRYISLLLGRPCLIHDDTVSQEVPTPMDDQHLHEEDVQAAAYDNDDNDSDYLLHATICQIQISRLVNQVIREQHEARNNNELVEIILESNQTLAKLKSELPPFLSGAVKASSLIPVLRRQATVIGLFYNHAVMMINRPLLLQSIPNSDTNRLRKIHECVDSCIIAAKDVCRQILRFADEGQKFEVFWFIQNIAFQALCILYLHLLRTPLEHPAATSKHNSYPSANPTKKEDLLRLAEDARKALSVASLANAPTLQYSVALEQLSREARQQLKEHGSSGRSGHHGAPDTAAPTFALGITRQLSSRESGVFATPDFDLQTTAQLNLDTGSTLTRQDSLDFDLDSDNTLPNCASSYGYMDASDDDLSRLFWPQLDAMPLLFEDWLSAADSYSTVERFFAEN